MVLVNERFVVNYYTCISGLNVLICIFVAVVLLLFTSFYLYTIYNFMYVFFYVCFE